jgi:hypothetical protein
MVTKNTNPDSYRELEALNVIFFAYNNFREGRFFEISLSTPLH